MKQVKIFTGVYTDRLSNDVNEFIKTGINLVEIIFHTNSCGMNVMIIYEV